MPYMTSVEPIRLIADRAQLHYKAALSSLSGKEGTDSTVEPVSGSSRPGLTGT